MGGGEVNEWDFSSPHHPLQGHNNRSVPGLPFFSCDEEREEMLCVSQFMCGCQTAASTSENNQLDIYPVKLDDNKKDRSHERRT